MKKIPAAQEFPHPLNFSNDPSLNNPEIPVTDPDDDWLIDWLIDWLTDWSIDCFIDWLTDWVTK